MGRQVPLPPPAPERQVIAEWVHIGRGVYCAKVEGGWVYQMNTHQGVALAVIHEQNGRI